MIFEETFLKDCYVITPNIFEDNRGYFYESFNKNEFLDKTRLSVEFVQDNQSKSSRGVLRGLHLQKDNYAQAKLVRVLQGSVLDVVVDLRQDSSTFGNHFSIILDNLKNNQLFVPRGFAHGFVVLEDDTIFSYKCDNYYNKPSEAGIRYDDPQINIDWGLDDGEIILSEKDEKLPNLKEYLENL
ncbi:dTDP-4-dehydrorhamnose 3,5-epimerase [Flavobacteriaceae bacterium MAR_2010_188]|nr:dTDP-4-dehydrorhamnose 3,5-epimerase [Flavobacteriaceae bacterium MAR_2010_188]